MSYITTFFDKVFATAINWWNQIYNYKYSWVILLLLLIILGFFSRVKNKIVTGILGVFGVIVALLLVGLLVTKGAAYLDQYSKEHPSTSTTEQTGTEQGKPEIYGIEPEEQYQPQQYEAPKQLYYSVSCSGCYAAGCPSNGYYYAGYDSGQYSYYYGLCKSCSCTSVVGHSFWK